MLAGAKKPDQLCTMAEMIRSACDYRFVGIYKIVRDEFVIVANREMSTSVSAFPISLGLAGAALEAKQSIMVADAQGSVICLRSGALSRRSWCR